VEPRCKSPEGRFIKESFSAESFTGREASTATSPLHPTNQRCWFHASQRISAQRGNKVVASLPMRFSSGTSSEFLLQGYISKVRDFECRIIVARKNPHCNFLRYHFQPFNINLVLPSVVKPSGAIAKRGTRHLT